MQDVSEEEVDILQRSTKKAKGSEQSEASSAHEGGDVQDDLGQNKRSYKETVTDEKRSETDEAWDLDDEGEASDDVVVEEGNGSTWFGIGMSKEEKIAARRPWKNSLIIKLVGRSIGYHYLWKRIQAMWRIEFEPLLIDLSNDFFHSEATEEGKIRACSTRWTVDDR